MLLDVEFKKHFHFSV